MFGILTLVWCGFARHFVRHPRWGRHVQKYANALSPYLLIAVGLWIVAEHPWIRSVLGSN